MAVVPVAVCIDLLDLFPVSVVSMQVVSLHRLQLAIPVVLLAAVCSHTHQQQMVAVHQHCVASQHPCQLLRSVAVQQVVQQA